MNISMLRKLYENFYLDENNQFLILADAVSEPDRIAYDTGLIQVMDKEETVVKIGRDIAESFKKIELEQRLNLFFHMSCYDIADVNIPHDDESYFIAAIPTKRKEIDTDGVPQKIEDGKVAVTFSQFYRSNVAQAEIDKAFEAALSERRDFYEAFHAKRFLDFLLAQLG